MNVMSSIASLSGSMPIIQWALCAGTVVSVKTLHGLRAVPAGAWNLPLDVRLGLIAEKDSD